MILVAQSDFKMIFRDASLRLFLVVPFLSIAMVCLLLPYLVNEYPAVLEYVPYVFMASLLQASTMFGFIYSFVLIDEKDTEVNKIYGVLPISKTGLISYRMIFPFLYSIIFVLILLTLQPFYNFPIAYQITLACLVSLLGPIFALLVSNYSKNKMQGLTIYKAINGIINLPLLAFFIPEMYGFIFGFIPSHWIFQEIFNYVNDGLLLMNMLIGFLLSIVILIVLEIQFSKKHFR